MKVYFAGPWFCKSQEEREERVKSKLRELGFEVHSPKEDSNITGSFMDPSFRKKVFESNIHNIDDCDVIFGMTDGKKCLNIEPDQLGKSIQAIDSGTMIECGYAYALRCKQKTSPLIVYYAETLGNAPFNLMLQESADIVITDFEDLNNISTYIENAKNGIRKVHNGVTE